MLLQTGIIRIKLIKQTITGGAHPILYLPAPSMKGLTLEWKVKSTTVELLDGSPRTRLLGYIPVLNAKWSFYSIHDYTKKYTEGITNGKMLNLEDLLSLLSVPTNTIAVSPGLSTGWFTADSIVVKPVGVTGISNVPTGVDITFTGRDIYDAMVLN